MDGFGQSLPRARPGVQDSISTCYRDALYCEAWRYCCIDAYLLILRWSLACASLSFNYVEWVQYNARPKTFVQDELWLCIPLTPLSRHEDERDLSMSRRSKRSDQQIRDSQEGDARGIHHSRIRMAYTRGSFHMPKMFNYCCPDPR